jgi:ATP-dependent DNA helicase RecG
MNIIDDINKGESKKTEFKSAMVDKKKFAKTIVAFSNTSGGKFIIGVADDKTVVGVDSDAVPGLIDRISNIIDDTCAPQIKPSIYAENVGGKIVVVTEIFPGAHKPYYIKSEGLADGVYIRIASTSRKANAGTIRELERERANIGFDEEICHDYERNPANEERFFNDFYKYTQRKIDEKDLVNLKLLKMYDGRLTPTNGYILFTDVNRHFDYILIKCARFKGNDTSRFIDRKEIELPVYEQIEATVKFAEMYIALGCEFVGARRIDRYAIPMQAIREAVTNAVLHREYGKDDSSITVNIFDDRIEITSPGALPGMLDVEQIKAGRSEIRNKAVARVLKEMGFIEQWGTGIGRIISESRSFGVREPEFEEIGRSFRVTVYASED